MTLLLNINVMNICINMIIDYIGDEPECINIF